MLRWLPLPESKLWLLTREALGAVLPASSCRPLRLLTCPPAVPLPPPPQIRDEGSEGCRVVTAAGDVHRCDAVVVSVPLVSLEALVSVHCCWGCVSRTAG